MRPFDLCRSPAGTIHFYEFDTPDERTIWNARLSAACSKVHGKLERTSINGFDTSNRPRYLLRVVVVTPGVPKKYGETR